jgi:putative endonuclease
MLRCKGERIYTGYATDVEARFRKHCEGTAAHFTRAFPPLEFLCSIPCSSRSEGLRLEARIKGKTRTEKLDVIQQNISGMFCVQDFLGDGL